MIPAPHPSPPKKKNFTEVAKLREQNGEIFL